MVSVLALGLAAGSSMPGHCWAAGGVLAVVSVLILGSIFRRRGGIIGPLIFCASAGYLAIQPWLVDAMPGDHVSRYTGDQSWRISGVVDGQPRLDGDRWRFNLAVDKLQAGSRRHRVSGRVMVSGRGNWPCAGRGDRVEFYGGLRAIRSFANPGGFDYKRFLALQAVRARSYAKAGTLKITGHGASGHWRASLDRCRGRLSEQMDAALDGYPPASVRLLKAILLGSQDRLPAAERQDFNRAGVGHVLAISGLHIGMVAAVSFGVAKWLLAWIPLLLRHAWTRRGAALISLAPVLGYGVLAGLSPSTQRAMIMVAVFLAGFWVGRRHDWLNTLALAALVILSVFPPALFSISFQLSFAAVLSILAGMTAGPGRSDARRLSPAKRLWQTVVSLLRVSLLAIIGTLPLVLRYFNQISIVAAVVNLVVVPLVGMLVLPAGLAGIAAAMVNADAAILLWKIAVSAMDVVRIIVQFTAQWPWSAVRWVTPSGFEICLYYLMGAFLIFRARIIRPRAVLAALLLLCILDVGYWTHERFGRTDFRVTALDVGQGTANLLQFPGGYTVLIDGGGFSDNRDFDVGANILAPLLWRRKITSLDLVVLSHANSDHLNGLLFVLENFKVKEIWSNGQASRSSGFKRWKRLIAQRRVPLRDMGCLPAARQINGVWLNVLAPPRDYRQRSEYESWRDLNSNCLVLQARCRNISFLFTGDITAAAEADMLARLGRCALRSTVLMVPHHGSGSSSTPAFLRAVQPKEALISCGWRNRFGFPDAQVMQRMKGLAFRSWCTADNGAIQVVTDGQSYSITTCRVAKPSSHIGSQLLPVDRITAVPPGVLPGFVPVSGHGKPSPAAGLSDG